MNKNYKVLDIKEFVARNSIEISYPLLEWIAVTQDISYEELGDYEFRKYYAALNDDIELWKDGSFVASYRIEINDKSKSLSDIRY